MSMSGPVTQQPDLAALQAHGTEPLACVSCRARKLKCDRVKPACTRCEKISNECVYPESRRKPTFKRRNVKELEARLAQVEDYLKEANKTGTDADANAIAEAALLLDDPEISLASFNFQHDSSAQDSNLHGASSRHRLSFDVPDLADPDEHDFDNTQLIGLGMSESLPPLEMMEELHHIFFLTHYHFIPVVHSGRYYQAFYGGPMRKPPMCLQYAIWAMAASGHAKYDQYADVFYKRARQYVQTDEMRGHGEYFITIAHAQAWALIATYEARLMLFTRTSMSTARCTRMIQMLGLDRLDGIDLDFPTTLSPPADWIELEERRRVFWGAFIIDAHASIATGWPSLIQSSDIMTRLPSTEESFASGQEETTAFLEEAFNGAHFGGFAGAVVISEIFKNILRHVHRTRPSDRPDDPTHGAYWKRHRNLDNQLSSLFMFLPLKFRIPQNLRDPVATHTNLNLHASVICLHHSTLEMIEKHGLDLSMRNNSLYRLRAAAEEIANIVKLTAHRTAIFKSPLCALSLYCATTVYVYLAKDDPEGGLSSSDMANMELIIHAMEAIGRVHQITCAFLQQACLDIEHNGLASVIQIPTLNKYRNLFGGPASNIPLLARSPISKHTKMGGPLPGRLPLDDPTGVIRPSGLRMVKSRPPLTGVDLDENSPQHCFRPVLGALTRNMAPRSTDSGLPHKRKRVSASPGPSSVVSNMEMLETPMGSGFVDSDGNFQTSAAVPTTMAGTGLAETGFLGSQGRIVNGVYVLPDRTNSSVSSPANRATGSGTQSGSSHTSPGGGGLGNKPEDNIVDLRQFQGRVPAPAAWQPMEDGVFMQFPETMENPPADTHNPYAWTMLTGGSLEYP